MFLTGRQVVLEFLPEYNLVPAPDCCTPANFFPSFNIPSVIKYLESITCDSKYAKVCPFMYQVILTLRSYRVKCYIGLKIPVLRVTHFWNAQDNAKYVLKVEIFFWVQQLYCVKFLTAVDPFKEHLINWWIHVFKKWSLALYLSRLL